MYFNRELSWLSFNYRVLQEAASPGVPLYERLKFLSIFSSNLDEFFRVRYPIVLAIDALKRKTKKQLGGNWSGEISEKIQAEITRQLEEFGAILMKKVLPALKDEGIYLYYNEPIRDEHREEVSELFLSKVLSFIQPLLLDGKKKFYAVNNQLYFAVSLKKTEEELIRHVIVNIPSTHLPRFFTLSRIDDLNYVVFIDDVIRENVQKIFPGFEILSVYSFKINRDAELHLDEEYEQDILNKIEKQLSKRDFGPPSRFLFEQGMPLNIQLFLGSVLSINLEEMFSGGRYHNLKDLADFPSFNTKLFYDKLEPVTPRQLKTNDIFGVIARQDVLLHLPYHSYNPILSFFNQSAIDPDVAEIYIALYRVAPESHIANALVSAARNGKKVTVFLELKARFDEANNISWSRKMKEAGVKIIYSIPRIKVHSKIALIRKRSRDGDIDYSVLSTGNFNEQTAKFYTDHVLFTADPLAASELLQLFQFLQRRRLPFNDGELKFELLLVSQFNMMSRFSELIRKEMKNAKKGKKALIRIKLNNLEEKEMIDGLYKASETGVETRLIVRSICCIQPSQKKLSENITVKRIVDRYLEHSRLFIFGEGDDVEVMMGSADWMNRNLHSRIEVCFPVRDAKIRQQLIDYFDIQWDDNEKAVTLDAEMKAIPTPVNGGVRNAQQNIYEYIRRNS